MTSEELADKSFSKHELEYKLSRDERSFKEGFIEGLKAGRRQGSQSARRQMVSAFCYVMRPRGKHE